MNDSQNDGRRVYQTIADKIASQIKSGEISEGTRLPSIRELSEMFSASRTSVHEALLSLQSRGLITLKDRTRAVVTKVDNPAFFSQLTDIAQSVLTGPDGMVNFQEARILFECGLARYAGRHATPKQIERLRQALVENKKALADPDQFIQTDMAFHMVLAEIPQNPIFTALNQALAEWLRDQRATAMKQRNSMRLA